LPKPHNGLVRALVPSVYKSRTQ